MRDSNTHDWASVPPNTHDLTNICMTGSQWSFHLNSAPQAKILAFCVAQMSYKTVSKPFPHKKSQNFLKFPHVLPKYTHDSNTHDWASVLPNTHDFTRVMRNLRMTEKLCPAYSAAEAQSGFWTRLSILVEGQVGNTLFGEGNRSI